MVDIGEEVFRRLVIQFRSEAENEKLEPSKRIVAEILGNFCQEARLVFMEVGKEEKERLKQIKEKKKA